ncbi:MAG: ABC transporter substrate-binding protein, partial [Candidatus Muiribacteriaceae bacterium]
MRNRFFLIMIFTLSILLLTGCEDEQTAADRADCIEDDEQTLYIGVGWPLTGEDDTFRQGIDLAVEQVNSNGGVLGRELKVIYRDDKAEITEGFRVADSFSADSRIFAVIGHRNSYISLA